MNGPFIYLEMGKFGFLYSSFSINGIENLFKRQSYFKLAAIKPKKMDFDTRSGQHFDRLILNFWKNKYRRKIAPVLIFLLFVNGQ